MSYAGRINDDQARTEVVVAYPHSMVGDRVSGTGKYPTLSVCIVTYERPAFLLRCLDALAADDTELDVVVVDASGAAADVVVADVAPDATYVWAPQLAGWMTRSRNEALRHVSGDVIAFLDDDVCVHKGWARAMRQAFTDPRLTAAVGRTLNGQPDEEQYDRPIGRYLADGRLTEGFASRAPGMVEVDHGIGANMAFRRSVLADLGGFRDDYPGTALREDTDIFLRVKAVGGRAFFVPEAVVDHRPAPHVVGRRFDTRYKLYGRRNHMVLVARHDGMASRALRRWVRGELEAMVEPRTLVGKAQRCGVTLAGLVWGAVVLPQNARWGPSDPRRSGGQAEVLRRSLGAVRTIP